ncbi:MAG: hypothetical protein JSS96_12335 [Bacteroidetes bacterium]|nr:hypothetical protein [Bacteroidota bacterium]
MDFFNSKECEWADMEVTLAGAPVTKIRGIKYKAAKDKEALYAEGDQPLAIQSGNRSYEGQIKILKGSLDDLHTAALSVGVQDVLDLEFDVVVTYKPKGNRLIQQDVLVGVQVKEFELGWDQGAKHMEITLPIIFLRLNPTKH